MIRALLAERRIRLGRPATWDERQEEQERQLLQLPPISYGTIALCYVLTFAWWLRAPGAGEVRDE